MGEIKAVVKCPMRADAHMPMGRNVNGDGPSPYEPHAHPFSLAGSLVACCSGTHDCRIEGHITRAEGGYRHVAKDES